MDVGSRLLWISLTTKCDTDSAPQSHSRYLEIHGALDSQRTSHGPNCDQKRVLGERWSPVFVVGNDTGLETFTTPLNGFLWLFFDTKPIELAAYLDNHLPSEIDYGLFLTHGMASVLLLVHQSKKQVDPLSIINQRDPLRGVECWTICDGSVSAYETPTSKGISNPVLTNKTEQRPARTHSCGTFARHLQDNELYRRQITLLSTMVRPCYLKPLNDVFRRLSRLLEVVEGSSDSATIPWEDVQSSAYSVVYLNSMLAYSLSQGLSGYSPVLEHQGLLPSYSIFGVATAYQAVWTLTHFIEEAFLHFDILPEMTEHYFSKTSADYKAECFKPELNDMRPSPRSATDKAAGHLTLFSSRLGFHSSDWAVAAPVEVLHQAADPGWNLLTLTHEMLHVHVDMLLRFVLSPNPVKEETLTQDDLYRRMVELAHRASTQSSLTIIERLRQKIARYILQAAATRGRDEMPLSQLPRSRSVKLASITEPNQFRDMLKTFSKRLTEYIVHVLDFHYFYGADLHRYLFLVLTSWSSIPSVYDDIGHYIMRCLIALSTREMDPVAGTALVLKQANTRGQFPDNLQGSAGAQLAC